MQTSLVLDVTILTAYTTCLQSIIKTVVTDLRISIIIKIITKYTYITVPDK